MIHNLAFHSLAKHRKILDTTLDGLCAEGTYARKVSLGDNDSIFRVEVVITIDGSNSVRSLERRSYG